MPPPGVQKEVPHHAAPEAKVPTFWWENGGSCKKFGSQMWGVVVVVGVDDFCKLQIKACLKFSF